MAGPLLVSSPPGFCVYGAIALGPLGPNLNPPGGTFGTNFFAFFSSDGTSGVASLGVSLGDVGLSMVALTFLSTPSFSLPPHSSPIAI